MYQLLRFIEKITFIIFIKKLEFSTIIKINKKKIYLNLNL